MRAWLGVLVLVSLGVAWVIVLGRADGETTAESRPASDHAAPLDLCTVGMPPKIETSQFVEAEEAGCLITVRDVDTGDPVVGAVVHTTSSAVREIPVEHRRILAASSETGEISVPASEILSENEFATVSAPGYLQRGIGLVAGEAHVVELQLAHNFHLTFVDRSGQPVPRVMVRLSKASFVVDGTDIDTTRVPCGDYDTGVMTFHSDEAGTVALKDIPDGEFWAYVDHSEFLWIDRRYLTKMRFPRDSGLKLTMGRVYGVAAKVESAAPFGVSTESPFPGEQPVPALGNVLNYTHTFEERLKGRVGQCDIVKCFVPADGKYDRLSDLHHDDRPVFPFKLLSVADGSEAEHSLVGIPVLELRRPETVTFGDAVSIASAGYLTVHGHQPNGSDASGFKFRVKWLDKPKGRHQLTTYVKSGERTLLPAGTYRVSSTRRLCPDVLEPQTVRVEAKRDSEIDARFAYPIVRCRVGLDSSSGAAVQSYSVRMKSESGQSLRLDFAKPSECGRVWVITPSRWSVTVAASGFDSQTQQFSVTDKPVEMLVPLKARDGR